MALGIIPEILKEGIRVELDLRFDHLPTYLANGYNIYKIEEPTMFWAKAMPTKKVRSREHLGFSSLYKVYDCGKAILTK